MLCLPLSSGGIDGIKPTVGMQIDMLVTVSFEELQFKPKEDLKTARGTK